jgi:polysaccharide biosynthesis/export protein
MRKPFWTSFRCRVICLSAVLVGAALISSRDVSAQTPPSRGTTQADAEASAGAGLDGPWARWVNGRYRIAAGDVIDVKFPFVSELDQTVTVQPDGYITLREVGDLRAQGRTVPEFSASLREAYARIVREPVFTVVLKEFEKPYFVATGQVAKPGRYELRGATTLTQALAYAGGPSSGAKLSDVVIFRYHTEETVTVKQVDVNQMYEKRDLSEDPILRPGDTVLVPKSRLGKLAPILSFVNMGLYLNPFDLYR